MKIFNSIQEFSAAKKTVVTLGTFDGVHKGHKSILEKLIKSSKQTGCQSVVLTFFPHPRMVLQQNTDIKLLNTITEKAYLLEQCGIDNLIIHPFSHEFSRLTAEEFVKNILVDSLNICKIIIGHDHRFGRNRTADINDLIRFGHEYNFEVEQITALEVNAVSVSSTKIRHALADGDIATANRFLGYPYCLTGTVTSGKQLGRTIGFPTANISIAEDYKQIPAHGVYAVSSVINGKTVLGMMNIGTRPTVDGTTETIEAHFFDFDADIYNQTIKVSLHHRLRAEHKFESFDALKQQLEIDRIQTKAFFKDTSI
ncbi:bifunctional riboflavin kinase/FAD synthetase [Flavobacterium subsaxonicum]|uniref:Riboflavin biosynthesis protein n=1 Tax=Flavobacterium subsaxonicum WB 4.1-42 = DSM 21790 TaxID=1121898 RepID=A0A0A2MRN9_9FLAO|nr:bifunctional riboflavin kinase/FAD synthetase [Flavobacterium subsaxonicum]KGO90925.1 riboflavin biosynthesis protein RibF [Flavobacterium subsaxonicum WB 4.1-42 = DSM 21790]